MFAIGGVHLITRSRCEELLFEVGKKIESYQNPRVEPDYYYNPDIF